MVNSFFTWTTKWVSIIFFFATCVTLSSTVFFVTKR